MKCPTCQSTSTKTIDSRKSCEGSATRRRKQCTKCLHRFTTVESIDSRPVDSVVQAKQATYSVNEIKEVVAGYYGFPIESLEGEKKSDPESMAKYISYYICHTLGKKSAAIIAKYHNSKHTNSIYHGLKRAKDLININEIIKNDIDFIIGIIKTSQR